MGLIEKIDESYALSSSGKALCELSKNTGNKLSEEERIFYFTTMLTSELKQQLLTFFKIVYMNESQSRRKMIEEYFNTEVARTLWNEEVINKNLMRLKKDKKIPSFMQNKFGCMGMWLRDLCLIERKEGKVYLTKRSKKALKVIKRLRENINGKIYELAGISLVGKKTVPFDYTRHRKEFIKLLHDSYNLFKVPQTNLSDIRAIIRFMCVKFLLRKIKIEEEDFNETIKRLWSKGVVKSVMLGRDGKPANIVLTSI